MYPNNSIPRCIPKRNGNTYPHKNLHVKVHPGLFIIGKKWKQPQSPQTDNWINKGGYPCSRIQVSFKKGWSTDTGYNTDGPWKHHAKWKKPDTASHRGCGSIDTKWPDWPNPQSKKISDRWGLRRKDWGGNQQVQGFSPRRWECSGIKQFWRLHKSVYRLKPTELYTWKDSVYSI